MMFEILHEIVNKDRDDCCCLGHGEANVDDFIDRELWKEGF